MYQYETKGKEQIKLKKVYNDFGSKVMFEARSKQPINKSGIDDIRKHKAANTRNSHTIVQRMRFDPYVPGTFPEGEAIMETMDCTTEDLQEVLDNAPEYPLTKNATLILEKIIADRKADSSCEFERAYGADENMISSGIQLAELQSESVLANSDLLTSLVSGNDSRSLTDKKGRHGNIRKLQKQEGNNLHQTVAEFYKMADSIPQVQGGCLEVYRGISIARTDDIEAAVSAYSEVLPCSTSWSINTPLMFAGEGSALQDSLVLKLIVLPGSKIVSMSFPGAVQDKGLLGKSINQPQEEVLLGAFRVKEIMKIDTMEWKKNNIKEEVEEEKEEEKEEKEEEKEEIETSRLIFATVLTEPLTEQDVHQKIDESANAVFPRVMWNGSQIRKYMDVFCAGELVKLLVGQESKYKIGDKCCDKDGGGPYIIIGIRDEYIELEDWT